ncbi:MAG: methyltransferase domain-containing protein [Dehalococcoidia bacterium]
MPDYVRIYARQEYLTPGAARTVELIAERAEPSEGSLLVDVAAGKGEAACTLAGRFACRVLAVEPYDPFVNYAAAKAWHWNLRDLVTVLRANGRRLPIRDAACDTGYCIGGPSIVGLERCLAELSRVVKPGGHVVVSDIVWRSRPEPPLGPEWRYLAGVEPKPLLDEYIRFVANAGLTVPEVHVHERSDWEDYFRPMLQVAEEARTGSPADPFLADEIESTVELERRAVEEYLDYVTLLARKPEG